MPTLEWIGRKGVLSRHREVPYHLLRCDEKLSVRDPDSGNVLTGPILAELPAHDGPRVIYVEGNRAVVWRVLHHREACRTYRTSRIAKYRSRS